MKVKQLVLDIEQQLFETQKSFEEIAAELNCIVEFVKSVNNEFMQRQEEALSEFGFEHWTEEVMDEF